MLKLVNLCDHPIEFWHAEGRCVIPPSGVVARVDFLTDELMPVEVLGTRGEVLEIPVTAQRITEIYGLPPPEEGVLYLASSHVALTAGREGRSDVLAPATQSHYRPVKDRYGAVKAVTQLLRLLP